MSSPGGADSEHGFHGITTVVDVSEDLAVRSYTRPVVATHTRIVVGAGILLGLFGAITLFQRRGSPPAPRGSSAALLTSTALLAWLLTPGALAHNYWMEPADKILVVVFGHGADQQPYDPAEVGTAEARDASGHPAKMSRRVKDGRLYLEPGPGAAVVTLTVDRGNRIKTDQGWKTGTLREGGRIYASHRAVQFVKAILNPSAGARPCGQRLEIVAADDLSSARPGSPFPFKALFEGKPLANAAMETGDHQELARTDSPDGLRLRGAGPARGTAGTQSRW